MGCLLLSTFGTWMKLPGSACTTLTPTPGPQETLQLHSAELEAPALSLHLRFLSSPRGWPVLGLQLEPLSGGLAGPGHLGTLQGQGED